MGEKSKPVMTFVLMSWAGSELHSGFALQSSGCCWWTGLFCNLCVWAALIPWQKGIFSYSVLLKLCSWLFAGRRKGVIVVL